MTLSPFEVERQEFGTSAMGYRRKEVDSFMDEVRQSMVGLWQERSDLREENERLYERVARSTARWKGGSRTRCCSPRTAPRRRVSRRGANPSW